MPVKASEMPAPAPGNILLSYPEKVLPCSHLLTLHMPSADREIRMSC